MAVAQTAGFTSNGLSIVISSANPADVATATDEVVAALSDNGDLLNLKTDLSKGTPEVQVVVDANKAVGVGLTAAQVAGEVRTALVGSVATTVQLDVAGDPIGVYVQVDPARISGVDALRAMPVGTAATVPLGSIAAVDQVLAQGSITRVDEAPAATVSAEIASDDTGAVSIAVQHEIDGLVAAGKIPAGVNVELAGVTQQMNEAFGNLFLSMGVAILLVYVMMVLTFNSLVTPFIILFSLPLATIGAFPALLLTGRPIGVSALIGFLMLIGIVVTNAIVLLDLVERLRREGHSTRDALIEGGRTRVRPILMTAIATILALIPLAAGLSKGSIIAAELGTVVIGGLFSSTFLTLLVIPVLYSLVEGGKSGLAGRFRRADAAEPRRRRRTSGGGRQRVPDAPGSGLASAQPRSAGGVPMSIFEERDLARWGREAREWLSRDERGRIIGLVVLSLTISIAMSILATAIVGFVSRRRAAAQVEAEAPDVGEPLADVVAAPGAADVGPDGTVAAPDGTVAAPAGRPNTVAGVPRPESARPAREAMIPDFTAVTTRRGGHAGRQTGIESRSIEHGPAIARPPALADGAHQRRSAAAAQSRAHRSHKSSPVRRERSAAARRDRSAGTVGVGGLLGRAASAGGVGGLGGNGRREGS